MFPFILQYRRGDRTSKGARHVILILEDVMPTATLNETAECAQISRH